MAACWNPDALRSPALVATCLKSTQCVCPLVFIALLDSFACVSTNKIHTVHTLEDSWYSSADEIRHKEEGLELCSALQAEEEIRGKTH